MKCKLSDVRYEAEVEVSIDNTQTIQKKETTRILVLLSKLMEKLMMVLGGWNRGLHLESCHDKKYITKT